MNTDIDNEILIKKTSEIKLYLETLWTLILSYMYIYLRFFTGTIHMLVGGLLIPNGIIRPEVSVSVLTWFIRYIYYWNSYII